MNCEILRGGALAVGDEVAVEAGSYGAGRANDGGKKAAFYKRPSLRTREEAKSLAQVPKDKPGVDRIMTAYATVGAGDAIGMSGEEVARQLERWRGDGGGGNSGLSGAGRKVNTTSSSSSSSSLFFFGNILGLVVERRRPFFFFFLGASVVFAACWAIAVAAGQ